MPKKCHIDIKLLKTDGLQMRAALDMDAVREYAEAERERSAVFPPLTVYKDKGGSFWLADGFHRLAAYRQNGKTKIACEVHDGEFVDALRAALSANVTHGMRRTNADKACAVKAAYDHRKRLGLPDCPAANLIAELVGVSPHTVEAQLGKLPSWKNAPARTGADGKTRSLPPPPTRKPDAGEAAARREVDEERAADEPAEPRRPLPPPPVAPPAPTRKAAPVLPIDERGKPVPAGLVETWNRRFEMKKLAGQISDVRCAIRAAQDGNDPLFGELNYSSVLANLDKVFTEITAAVPWCVCPSCQGAGCRVCKDRGLIGKFRFDNVVPGELKG